MHFDFSSLSFDGEEEQQEEQAQQIPRLSLAPVSFDNAEEFAEQMDFSKDYFCFLAGSFIFGDFLEALCFRKELNPSVMYVTTLGMSAENADSLVNLTEYLGCEKINLIVSHYFAGVERHNLIPYMRDEFAGQPIDIAVLQSHCKCALIRSAKGDVAITGSANLSSSNNVEQFIITHDPALIDFLQGRLDFIMEHFTIYRGAEETPRVDWKKNRKNTGKFAWYAINGWEVE